MRRRWRGWYRCWSGHDRARQREGIAAAKAAGKYKGRKPTARAKAEDVLELRRAGVGASEIARQLSIGRASVYRIIEDGDGGAVAERQQEVA